MKHPLLGLAICALAASVPAQIDAGPYVRTFSSTLTRGYFFQVPTNVPLMLVTHVQVPDEKRTAGHKQIIAIYRMSAAPPAFSGTVAVTPVFYSDKVGPGQRIAVVDQTKNNGPLIYQKDEWFAVLGCMGQTGTVDNSYGNAKVASSVLGSPITLQRCGIQANISVAKGVGAMWSEVAGSIGRVHVWVAGHGSSEQYGVGNTIGGELGYLSPPSIGKTSAMIFRAGAVNTGGMLALGINRANIPIGAGNNLLVLPVLMLLPVPGGAIPTTPLGTTISFPIPNQTNLLNTKIVFQGAEFRAGNVLALSNAVEWVVGK